MLANMLLGTAAEKPVMLGVLVFQLAAAQCGAHVAMSLLMLCCPHLLLPPSIVSHQDTEEGEVK